MTTQDPDGKDLGDQFAEAAKPHGTMSTRKDDPDRGSMTEALQENIEELGRGENPLAQGDEDSASGESAGSRPGRAEAEDGDGHAGVFSPGRSDEPD